MTRYPSGFPQPSHVLLVILIGAAGYGLYHFGLMALQRLQTLEWQPKTPELPQPPQAQPANVSLPALAVTRDRPLFWEVRRPPPPPKQVASGAADTPRLLGIVAGKGEGGFAVLAQGTPPQRKVVRLRAGQSLGVFTVQSVGSSGVELLGPDGPISLRPPRQANP